MHVSTRLKQNKIMLDIAICVVGYNRPGPIKRLLTSLSNAEYMGHCVKLYISIDKSNDNSVTSVADEYVWPYGEKDVILHEKNLGLRKHILSCGNLLENHDAIIVLEDDVVVSPSFYTYAAQCVEKYKDNDEIAGISLYGFIMNHHNHLTFWPMKTDSDVYLMQFAQSWGQVWMKNQWNDFMKWYSSNSDDDFIMTPHLPDSIGTWPKSSWLKYHIRYCIENDKYFVYPYSSLTTCFSDVGVHTKADSTYSQTPISFGLQTSFKVSPTVRYDAFFESMNVLDFLSEYKGSLCVDFYGEKRNREKRRYWLTREIADYKVIKSYAIDYKPYELNVLYDNIGGDDLFLYDTDCIEKNPRSRQHIDRKYYFYLFNIPVDKNAWELWDHLKRIIMDKLRDCVPWKR